jgi:hypothetical protein
MGTVYGTVLLLVFEAMSTVVGFSIQGASPQESTAGTPITIKAEEVRAHRTVGVPYIRTSFTSLTSQQAELLALGGLHVHVVANAAGAVVSAICVACTPDIASLAEAAVRSTKYRPVERDGNAVGVQFDERVLVLPPERPLARHVPFPAVNDWKSVRVGLRRTRCNGSCPEYSVDVQGDGTVLYKGEAWVAVVGEQRTSVSREVIIRLVDAFRDADFYSLDDEYVWAASDFPTYELSIEIDGHVKKIRDYAGLHVGMPMSIARLEDLVDRLANTQNWTRYGDWHN